MRVTRARHSPVITRHIHRDGQARGQPMGQGLVLDQWGHGQAQAAMWWGQ